MSKFKVYFGRMDRQQFQISGEIQPGFFFFNKQCDFIKNTFLLKQN